VVGVGSGVVVVEGFVIRGVGVGGFGVGCSVGGLVFGEAMFVAEFVGDEGCSGVEEVVCVSSQIVSSLSFLAGVVFGGGALVLVGL
jgi:hypothetical protein